MSVSSLSSNFADRQLIVVLICSEKSEFSTAVKFTSDFSHDVYIFSRVPVFRLYLQKLFEQLKGLPVRIVLVNRNLSIFIDALQMISTMSVPDLILRQREQFTQKYKSFLHSTTDTSAEGVEISLALPEGHADLPSVFELAVIQDCDSITETSYLTEDTIFLQQILRYIALKHGGVFGAISGLSSIVEEPSALINFVNRVFQSSISSDFLIFKPTGTHVVNELRLHQLVPAGWDSWNKILLIAKTISLVSSDTRLLRSENDMRKLDNIYSSHFNSILPKQEENSNHSTDNEATIRNCDLKKYLRLDGTCVSEHIPEQKSISYEEFLQSF